MNSTIQTAWRTLNKPVSTFFPIGFFQHGKGTCTETSKVDEQTQKAAEDKAKRKQIAAQVASNLGELARGASQSAFLLIERFVPEEQIIIWAYAQGQTVNGKCPTVKQVKESIKLFRAGQIDGHSLSEDVKADEKSEAELHDLDFFREHFPDNGTATTSHRLYWLLASAPERVQKTCAYLLASIAQGVVTKSEILELLDPPEVRKANRKPKAK